MGEPQIRLNAEQYARYVELYNDPSKSPYATEYFKTAGTDMGFAAVIGGMHFSRSPNVGRYDGHFGHLHSDSATAHNMLKSSNQIIHS